jgi:hypothetical protein
MWCDAVLVAASGRSAEAQDGRKSSVRPPVECFVVTFHREQKIGTKVLVDDSPGLVVGSRG